MDNFIIFLKIIFALAIIWPRGYMLIYLIDRSKSFSFGFKFFVGWLIGLAGFTLDVFSYNVFMGFKFSYLIFLWGAISQIFGFGFMVFLFERKVPWPKFKRFKGFIQEKIVTFKNYPNFEKVSLIFLVSVILLQLFIVSSRINSYPIYTQDNGQSLNFKAKTIFFSRNIVQDPQSAFYLGGGESVKPLNDTMLRVWLSANSGYSERNLNYISVFYYLLLLAIFYFCLPKNSSVVFKNFTTAILAFLPPLMFGVERVPSSDWLLAIFMMLMLVGYYYYLVGQGNSYFYFSGIAWAFAAWTDNSGLLFLFPALLLATTITLALKKVSKKDYLLSWFFAILTAFTWLSFIMAKKVNIMDYDLSYFFFQFLPLIILFAAMALQTLVKYLKKLSAI